MTEGTTGAAGPAGTPEAAQAAQGAGEWRGWRSAARDALYGPRGFYRRPEGPAGHFRTSVHASPLFAAAVARLLGRVDEALGRPPTLDFVDLGAGRGELAAGVLAALPAHLSARTRITAVELADRPPGLDPRIGWRDTPPRGSTGLLFANEWLDNVPVDIVEVDAMGVPRRVRVRDDGTERLGERIGTTGAHPRTGPRTEPGTEPVGEPETEAGWLARWWPLPPEEGRRAEIGLPRDSAWAAAVSTLGRGLAVAVDYAHTADARPPFGTLTGFRDGREVRPVPDGSCDITAHVALDACARACGRPGARLLTQRAALRALELTGVRPPLTLATTDPAAYLRALAHAGEAAELTAPEGLGGFGWLLQPVGLTEESAAAPLALLVDVPDHEEE